MILLLCFVCLHRISSLEVSQHPQYLLPHQSYTLGCEVEYFQEFCFLEQHLAPNQRYDVKVSFNGSDGIDIQIVWKTTNSTLQQMLTTFQPMDTQKLRFLTDANDEYCFYMVGYRNTRAVSQEAKMRAFKYIIKIEEVLIDDLPLYAVIQYVGAFVLSVVLTKLLIKVIERSAECNSFLRVKQERLD